MKMPRAKCSFDQFLNQIEMFGYFNNHIFPQAWFDHPQIEKYYTLEGGLLDLMLDFNLPELTIANTTKNGQVSLTGNLKTKIKNLYSQDLKFYEEHAIIY
jgi:hypothetical protein